MLMSKKIVPSINIWCCDGYKHIVDLQKLDNEEFNDMEYLNIVHNNTRILGKTYDWLTLLFMEALFIKELNSTLNVELKQRKIYSYFNRHTISVIITFIFHICICG